MSSPSPLPGPGPSISSAPTRPLSVYFDGGCPLCRAEVAAYQCTEGGERLNWVDVHACSPGELGDGLSREAALKRMHVRRGDGRLVDGAAAFVEIWALLPKWAWLARVARLPGVIGVLEIGIGSSFGFGRCGGALGS